jgi:hypothetical protein
LVIFEHIPNLVTERIILFTYKPVKRMTKQDTTCQQSHIQPTAANNKITKQLLLIPQEGLRTTFTLNFVGYHLAVAMYVVAPYKQYLFHLFRKTDTITLQSFNILHTGPTRRCASTNALKITNSVRLEAKKRDVNAVPTKRCLTPTSRGGYSRWNRNAIPSSHFFFLLVRSTGLCRITLSMVQSLQQTTTPHLLDMPLP